MRLPQPHPAYRNARLHPPAKCLREYVVDERIAAAKILLESSERSISDIASLLRFCDQSYFTYSFRERTGQTPSQYRRTHRV